MNPRKSQTTASSAKTTKARPGKRQANKEQTKQAILAAALRTFSQKGFHAATTKEISRQVRIAEGTLFNYFRTKEDLALYFFEQELTGLIDWFDAESRLKKAPLPEKLFAIIYHHLERITPYEDFIGAVYLRALQPSSKLNPLSLERKELNLRYLKFIRNIFAEAEAAGEIPRTGDAATYGFGLLHVAMITYWLHDVTPGKQNTLALLDRCLKFGTAFLQKGGWEW